MRTNVHEKAPVKSQRAEFVLRDTVGSNGTPSISYLSLKESFNRQFKERLSNGLDGLLSFGSIETGNISGNLLVVPIADKTVEETYEMRLEQQIKASQSAIAQRHR